MLNLLGKGLWKVQCQEILQLLVFIRTKSLGELL